MNNFKKQFNKAVNTAFVQPSKVIKKTFENGLNAKNVNIPIVVSDFIAKNGDKKITGLTIYRHPVQAIITGALNLLSTNGVPYDKLFHLRLNFTLENGQEHYIEKNERLNLGKGSREKGFEILKVTEIPDMTFRQMFENTQQLMGIKFLSYSASSNNCQNFVLSIFKASHIDKPEYVDFIKQNTESIFKNNH